MHVGRVLAGSAALVVLAACGREQLHERHSGATEAKRVQLSNGAIASSHGSRDISAATEVVIEAHDNHFDPTILLGNPGQKLTIHLDPKGIALHNFSLEDQGVDLDIQSEGEGPSVKVTFPSSGGLVFECKYHLAENMRGELRVSTGG